MTNIVEFLKIKISSKVSKMNYDTKDDPTIILHFYNTYKTHMLHRRILKLLNKSFQITLLIDSFCIFKGALPVIKQKVQKINDST